MTTKTLIPKQKTDVTKFVSRGRPTKITKAVVESIYQDVTAGIQKDRAANLAGISVATYHNWMAKGREIVTEMEKAQESDEITEIVLQEHEILYLDLLEAVAVGEAEFIRAGTASIRAEGPAGYKWLMSRLFPKHYGEKISTGSGEPLKLQLTLPGMVKTDTQGQNPPVEIDDSSNTR